MAKLKKYADSKIHTYANFIYKCTIFTTINLNVNEHFVNVLIVTNVAEL